MASKLLWNDGWEFCELELGEQNCQMPEKASWRKVDIPHDWMIYDTHNLYRNSIGWYRKKMIVEKEEPEEEIVLRFDGVYMDSSVFVNGNPAGEWKYGYSAFEVEITPFLKKGENLICVRAVYCEPNTRWYSGAGIYRNVWLKKRKKNHIASDGVYITPVKLKGNTWSVEIDTEVVLKEAARRKLKQLREMGFLIVSEAFDMWEKPKTAYDYARFFNDWHEKDAASWIRRDRNHASLMMWSIGNEIQDTLVKERGLEITINLKNAVRRHDYKNHAPVTLGSNFMKWENPQECAKELDCVGHNYSEYLYEEHHKAHKDWIIYGSETAFVLASRGIYHFPLNKPILTDEDEQCSALGNSITGWGAASYEACICDDRDAEFSLGQFIWTGFDYIGESTPYETKNSYYGQIDTAGFPKDSFYIFQSEWTDYREKRACVSVLGF